MNRAFYENFKKETKEENDIDMRYNNGINGAVSCMSSNGISWGGGVMSVLTILNLLAFHNFLEIC